MAENEKAYKVGISTGFWYIGKDPALLGIANKIGGLGATGGIQFVQIDLETVAEFFEPGMEQQVKNMMKKLGIKHVGLHGEIGESMSVDCAEKRVWDQTHERLVKAIKYAKELGFFYVNIHFSLRPLLSFMESQQRSMGYMYPVVGPDGRAIQYIIKGNPKTEKEAVSHMPLRRGEIENTEVFQEELKKYIEEKVRKNLDRAVNERIERELRNYPEEQRKEIAKRIDRKGIENDERNNIIREAQRGVFEDEQFLVNTWTKLRDTDYEKYLLSDGEIGAFAIVAQWMKEKNDYLWTNITGGKEPADLFFENEKAYCAAVASKYIEGHLTVKNRDLEGMSIKEWCEKHGLYMLFENPEANRGQEHNNRLFDPKHYYHTIKNINSPFVKICLDVEHMVSHALNPDDEFPKLPGDFGKYVLLWHLGQAVPYGGTAHIPIARGSIAQEQIYKWLYWIRKKGWKSGYILFERGGGRSGSGRSNYEVFEDSVLALKIVAEYLEKDIDPKKLPMAFYGLTPENKGVWARQVVLMREHAWDPLEGLLSVPEEKHTFLSAAAVAKQKGQEWEKRKYR
ncbi:MAG TPA: hypothetical protein VJI12_04680 [archaeon]|nr:hypothetical protein [archaeon]